MVEQTNTLPNFSLRLLCGHTAKNILAKFGAVVRGDTGGKATLLSFAAGYYHRYFVHYIGAHSRKLAANEYSKQFGKFW